MRMKKSLVFAAMMFSGVLCASARADLLYWMVDPELSAQYQDYKYAAVSVLDANNPKGDAIGRLDIRNDDNESLGPRVPSMVFGDDGIGLYAAFGDYDGAGYLFRIELLGDDDRSIAAGESLGIASLGDYISTVEKAMDPTQAKVDPWTGGAFTVPEPTSGLLMLLGVAALGLRRKKILV